MGLVFYGYLIILLSEIASKFDPDLSILERLNIKRWLTPGNDPEGERLDVDEDGNFTIHEKNYRKTTGNIYKDQETLRRHGYRTSRISKGTKYDKNEVDEWVKKKD